MSHNHPKPPEAVVQEVIKYQRPGEKYDIFNTRTQFNESLYYYTTYLRKGNIIGHLIVREDGQVPSFSDAKDILRMAIGINSKFYQFLTLGPRWAYTVDKVWNNQLKRLENMYKKYEVGMPPEIKEAFYDFMRVPQVFLKEQKEIEDAYTKMKKLKKEVSGRGKIADKTVDEQLDSLWDQFFHGKNNQHLIFLQTTESRKKVLRWLSKTIPFWNLPDRWLLFKLKGEHKAMLFSDEEAQDVWEVQDDVTRDNTSEENFREILDETRNPRSTQ
ncbi:hypothetical protein [Paludifilum halophilum]|uniref:Uncharacterized protein n=1 Tax=Paludifilum halophilum TaxID=1642702 RepID=A0A235B1N7_9BACL|nr:hypothetical protein [Paludifilum halophilum]OYD06141.1 hypothetical protein CHM34_17965 [Paludifilum halophilum]